MKKIILISLIILNTSSIYAEEFSSNFGVENNKLLRGFSLTNDESSINGFAGYGNQYFYTGAKVFSNIQINNGETEELVDWFVGKHFENRYFTFDLGYVHHYFTQSENTDSGEWYVGALLNNHTLHFYQNNDLDETYLDYNSSFSLFRDYKLYIHAGVLNSSRLNEKDFTDYSVGVGKTFSFFDAKLSYAYNDNKGVLQGVAGDNLILSFSKNW